ncbi:MAG TPA: hypothetical protein PLP48_00370 [Acholeplasmataceae bacterium]|nr:hypothetical protein [Acholeplasmataceae bacterium]
MAKNKRIGRIKYAFDDVLFKGDPKSGHHVYVSAHDKRSDRVMVNVISSIEDESGVMKPNARQQINKHILLPISKTSSTFIRFSGVKMDGLTYNNRHRRALVYLDLYDSHHRPTVSKKMIPRIQRFIFRNRVHPTLSKQNRIKARFK